MPELNDFNQLTGEDREYRDQVVMDTFLRVKAKDSRWVEWESMTAGIRRYRMIRTLRFAALAAMILAAIGLWGVSTSWWNPESGIAQVRPPVVAATSLPAREPDVPTSRANAPRIPKPIASMPRPPRDGGLAVATRSETGIAQDAPLSGSPVESIPVRPATVLPVRLPPPPVASTARRTPIISGSLPTGFALAKGEWQFQTGPSENGVLSMWHGLGNHLTLNVDLVLFSTLGLKYTLPSVPGDDGRRAAWVRLNDALEDDALGTPHAGPGAEHSAAAGYTTSRPVADRTWISLSGYVENDRVSGLGTSTWQIHALAGVVVEPNDTLSLNVEVATDRPYLILGASASVPGTRNLAVHLMMAEGMETGGRKVGISLVNRWKSARRTRP